MSDEMKKAGGVLLTNDDGVDSPGLLAAAEALSPLARLRIVAPMNQQTAMGRAKTGNPEATLLPKLLTVGGQAVPAYACDASPAAAVGHGLSVMAGDTPNLVVSGINYGENLGANVTSSGTVGAAMEAACCGIPSIAISLETAIGTHYAYTEQEWTAAIYFLRYFAQIVLKRGLPPDVHILKIDVPRIATPETPWRLTTLSSWRHYQSRLEDPTLDSRLRDARVIKASNPNEAKETDVYALSVDNVVSVTPLTLDLTSRTAFGSIHSWLTEGLS
ncbi:5'/3'-nucleotidase SurE [Desulfoluna sp.]|uniref:5'/3'-nucleotidase SurE n=1 Tax=Desulfoluna sp. TaxID=2045199 RepID=UPI0026251C59|nr:5'/3'-nucleotidase SurE [Desulfoluna sp.]